MIKARIIGGNGEQIAVLGLSGENMARLMADEPIMVDLAEVGLPHQKVIIIGGPNEQAMADYIQAAVTKANS